MMSKTVKGTYRQGKIELLEIPENITEETSVFVTFIEPGTIDLPALGIDKTQAADLRARLSTFIEDWNRPEMDIYDHYDAVKSEL